MLKRSSAIHFRSEAKGKPRPSLLATHVSTTCLVYNNASSLQPVLSGLSVEPVTDSRSMEIRKSPFFLETSLADGPARFLFSRRFDRPDSTRNPWIAFRLAHSNAVSKRPRWIPRKQHRSPISNPHRWHGSTAGSLHGRFKRVPCELGDRGLTRDSANGFVARFRVPWPLPWPRSSRWCSSHRRFRDGSARSCAPSGQQSASFPWCHPTLRHPILPCPGSQGKVPWSRIPGRRDSTSGPRRKSSGPRWVPLLPSFLGFNELSLSSFAACQSGLGSHTSHNLKRKI